jgi:phospholipase/carboxylesterase
LHGLGADANDFVSIPRELNLPADIDMRFIFPNAPYIPITISNGYEMRAWYDIYGIAIDAKTDSEGIKRSAVHIEKLIEKELEHGIPSSNIFLAGFSQGAAIALTTGIRYHKPLAGIIALSGYLPLAQDLSKDANPANQNLPIFLAHGSLDPVVPYGLGLASQTVLKNAGYPVSWHTYPIAHNVCQEEINDISGWLRERLAITAK